VVCAGGLAREFDDEFIFRKRSVYGRLDEGDVPTDGVNRSPFVYANVGYRRLIVDGQRAPLEVGLAGTGKDGVGEYIGHERKGGEDLGEEHSDGLKVGEVRTTLVEFEDRMTEVGEVVLLLYQ
jgi:hypothetical protein